MIVLGMHRSGTSCLAGSLEQAGLYLGDVNRHAPHNVKGNRENRAIMALNDAVLSEHGATWDDPPKSVIRWSNSLKNSRDVLLSNYPNNRTFGFKDPRTLFTLEGWLEALPGARLVGTFRHPNAVVQSLNRRAGMQPVLPPLELWKRYNLRLLKYADELQFPLINFDSPGEQYLRDFKALVDHLNLSWSPDSDSHFFDATLRTGNLSGAVDDFVDSEARAIYQKLLQYAVCGD